MSRSGAAAKRLPREPVARRRADVGVLPPRPRIFVDRADILEDLSDRLSDSQRSIVQLRGRPGIGRTTLMRQLLGDPSVTALDGAFFFGAGAGPNDIMQEMFETAYETDRAYAPNGDLRSKLLDPLRLLVVIDDFDGTDETVGYLSGNAKGSSFIFVTDARKLEAVDEAMSLEEFDRSNAARLFTAVQASISRSAAIDMPDLSGASPLDIVRIAAVHEPNEETDGAEAQRIMLASLSATDRLVLAPFVVTKGGPLDPAVAGELAGLPSPTPILESLEARGLMDFDGTRYRLRPELVDQVQVPITSQRILNALAVFDEKLEAGATAAQLSAFALAANNVLEAALKDLRFEAVITTGRLLSSELMLAARFDCALATLELVLDAARKSRDREIEGWSLHQIGTIAFVTGDETAQTTLSRALEVRERIEDRAGAALTRQNLALLLGISSHASSAPEEDEARIRLAPVLFGVAAGVAALVAAALFLFKPFGGGPVRAPVHAHHRAAHAKALAASNPSPLLGPALSTDETAAETPEPARAAPPLKPEPKSDAVAAKAAPSAKVAVARTPRPHRSSDPIGIDSFEANPATVAVGEYAQLCFSIRNASAARIEGIGPVSARGAHCVTIHPSRTSTYTLLASAGGQSMRAYTTLSVTATAAKPDLGEQ